MIRITKYVIALVCTVIFLCPALDTEAEVVDRIVAVVNGSVITLSELNAAVSVAVSESKVQGSVEEVRTEILDRLVENRLMEQAASKAGIDVSEKEIENAIEDVRRQNNLNKDELIVALTKIGLTYRGYKEQIKTQIRKVKFIEREFRRKVKIPVEDIEDYYRQNRRSFYRPYEFKLRAILVRDNGSGSARQRMEGILEVLKSGEPFAEVAMRYSEAPNAKVGGDLGFLREGEMDRSIEEAAKALEIGEFSGIIDTGSGFYIIKLEDRRDRRTKTLAEVKDEIRKILFKRIVDDRYKVWLEDMKSRSLVDIRL